MKKTNKSDLEEALKLCKGAFISAAGFSMVINLLQLVPTIYMLQLYDRVVPTGNQSTLLLLTLIMLVLFLTMGSLEWVRSQILVRVSSRLETLLNERLFQAAYKQSLYTGGQGASSQPLDDLTSLRQFMTGSGLFAFFDVPWMPVYIAVMFIFHQFYGWAAVATSIILIIVAIIQEKSTSKLLGEANALAIAGREYFPACAFLLFQNQDRRGRGESCFLPGDGRRQGSHHPGSTAADHGDQAVRTIFFRHRQGGFAAKDPDSARICSSVRERHRSVP